MQLRDRVRIVASVSILGIGVALVLLTWYWGAPEEQATARERLPTSNLPTGAALALAAGPPEAVANNVGVGYAADGHYEEAIGHFTFAVTRNPDYLPGHKNLLAACVETGRWEEALRAARKTEERHPLTKAVRRERPPADEHARQALGQEKDLIANLSRTYLENGEWVLAERRYMLFLRLFPNDLRGWNGLAEVALRQEDYEKALQLFAQSMKLYGDQPEVLSRLTTIQEKSPELAGKVQWVLANYLEPKSERPAARTLPGLEVQEPQFPGVDGVAWPAAPAIPDPMADVTTPSVSDPMAGVPKPTVPGTPHAHTPSAGR
jgi:tetratricopeptide (TPR) repeat protein